MTFSLLIKIIVFVRIFGFVCLFFLTTFLFCKTWANTSHSLHPERSVFTRFTFSRFLRLQLGSSSGGLSQLQTPDPADLRLHDAAPANVGLGDASSVCHNGTGALTLNRKLMDKLFPSLSSSLSLPYTHYLPFTLSLPLSCLRRVKGGLHVLFFLLNSVEWVKGRYRACLGLTPGTHTSTSPTKTDVLH